MKIRKKVEKLKRDLLCLFIAAIFGTLMLIEGIYGLHFVQSSDFGMLLRFGISFLFLCAISLTMVMGIIFSSYCFERKEMIKNDTRI